MPWRLAVGVYKEYYRSLRLYYYEVSIYGRDYGKFITSFLAELENSAIPDWAREHFVNITLNHSMNFESNYWLNHNMIMNQSDKKISIKWDKEQREALFLSCEVMKKAVQRTINKTKGTIYPDEEKYKGLVEVIEKNGGLYSSNLLSENSSDIVELYTNFVTQGRLYSDVIEPIKEEAISRKRANKIKNILK